MKNSEMKRLIKVEDRIYTIAKNYGLDFGEIEFDIIPKQKMMEIMAYRVPGNISNWKYGRDFERIKTFQEKIQYSLPLEVVINADPARAYLMQENLISQQIMVISHVVGHCFFFQTNKHFQRTRRDITILLSEASKRFEKYERKYGINEVEKIIDAGHSIQFHSSPFDTETEDEKRERKYEQLKLKKHFKRNSDFSDFTTKDDKNESEDFALQNQKIWKELKLKTPVESTEDLLRYIIDNSTILSNWQKDVLETLRQEGEYFWPQMRTQQMNEGVAVYVHEMIMNQLFKEDVITKTEFAQYNYMNSLVKATNKLSMNPYLIGSKIWENIVDRWDKGKHGYDYNNCTNLKEKENWDDKSMKGKEKLFEVVRNYTDWFFMQNFLTPELVESLNLYIYAKKDNFLTEDYVISDQSPEDICKMVSLSFAYSGTPKIKIENGNYNNMNQLLLKHEYNGLILDEKYCFETMKHIYNLWGNSIFIDTVKNDERVVLELRKK